MKDKDGVTIIVNTGGKRGGKTEMIQKIIENETVAKEKYTDDGVLIYEPEPHPEKEMKRIRYEKHQRAYELKKIQNKNERISFQRKKEKERNKKKMVKKSKRRNR